MKARFGIEVENEEARMFVEDEDIDGRDLELVTFERLDDVHTLIAETRGGENVTEPRSVAGRPKTYSESHAVDCPSSCTCRPRHRVPGFGSFPSSSASPTVDAGPFRLGLFAVSEYYQNTIEFLARVRAKIKSKLVCGFVLWRRGKKIHDENHCEYKCISTPIINLGV